MITVTVADNLLRYSSYKRNVPPFSLSTWTSPGTVKLRRRTDSSFTKKNKFPAPSGAYPGPGGGSTESMLFRGPHENEL